MVDQSCLLEAWSEKNDPVRCASTGDLINGVCRGKVEQGRRVLERVRGTKNVDAEFTDICEAVEVSNAIAGRWRALFSKKYRGVLVSPAAFGAIAIRPLAGILAPSSSDNRKQLPLP